jgi:flagellar P-ring protein precursor FlgI
VLKDADFTNVSKIAKAINDKFAAEIALPEDGSLVKVKVPPEYEGKLVEFIADIEEIEIEPDVPLRVVVNERTGTVVMGGEIKVREVAVTHGNLSVVVREKVEEIEEVPEGRERIERTMIIPEAPNVNDVVRALNAIGATPRDIIAILQAIKAAGALHAELIIM